MSAFGIVLVLIGVVAGIFGFLKHQHGKKILAAPFAKTGHINPSALGPKGEISTEGAADGSQLLTAPCSGTPCLYYEVVAYQKWEKSEVTEDGAKKTKGRDKHEEIKLGAIFDLNDGSGAVRVDLSSGVAGDLEKTFSDSSAAVAGQVSFGSYTTAIDQFPGNKYSKGLEIEERVLKPSSTMFVMGKYTPAGITKTDGMLGKLVVAAKGREHLLGKSAKQAKFGLIGGGVAAVAGVVLAIVGGPISGGGGNDSCVAMKDVPGSVCSFKLNDDSWKEFTWTVTKPGIYSIEAKSPAGKKISTLPDVEVAEFAKLAKPENKGLGDVESEFAAGTYKIRVRDDFAKHLKGGFSVELHISQTPENAAASNAASKAAAVAAAPGAPAPMGKPSEGSDDKTVNGKPFAKATADDFIAAYSKNADFKITANKETVSGPMKMLMIQFQAKKIASAKTLNSITLMVMRSSNDKPLDTAMIEGGVNAVKQASGGAGEIIDGASITVNTNLDHASAEAILADLFD